MTASNSDAFVIGAGPAGLAAAIALRTRGLAVTVADAQIPPIDKACGEGILPGGVAALRRLGIPIDAAGGFPIRGIRFLEGSSLVEAPFPSGHGIGISRRRLHELLTCRAESLGVHVSWGATVCSASLPPSCWIVGADGQASRVRVEAGLDSPHLLTRRFGFRRHYNLAPWTDRVEVYWGPRCQFFVTPVAEDEIGVAVLTHDPHQRIDALLPSFPLLQRCLCRARPVGPDRGAAATVRFLRRVSNRRTALIGDASGSVDAIGGDGLSLCFLQALALADAVAAGDLRLYQSRHRRPSIGPAIASNLLLVLNRLPLLRRGIWNLFAACPSLFAQLVALHDHQSLLAGP